ncbi:LADA_0A07096g1_1 [Lachancea dasiensis]|uniref:Histone acetyltransferase type B catalytic subunit n=1 Tax=Lachancea dasiensis TaxID=1072105 RepID=A0A1G4IPQ9_9SACH|nr:LADA_0A07096g1_1 [Lachancea dasiensis]
MDAASQMKPDAWTVSSNEALKLSLVDEQGAVQFCPIFTYPIFGDSEQIFGYQDLQIFLAFDSITFKPFSNVRYSAKLMDTVDDVQKKILEFLPPNDVVVKDEISWVDMFTKERLSFNLPGSHLRIKSYDIEDEQFAIYKVQLQDPKIKLLHKRMQIFTLFFIESASYIDDEDEGWEIFLTFNVKTKQCIGYSTTYQYWKYTGGPEFDIDANSSATGKISQFLIFPPYQGKGHGSLLYNAIFDIWLGSPSVREITVEDPNESFDILRDRNDFLRLQGTGFAEAIPDQLPLDQEWLKSQRLSLKLEKRQFMRLIEMTLLNKSSLNFRLQVKKRLFEKNFEILSDLDIAARNDKLQSAFISVKEEYESILRSLKSAKRLGADHANSAPKRLKTN